MDQDAHRDNATPISSPLDGRYRILSRLGSGGMADVYLARDESLGRQVAVKVLKEPLAADQEFVERFRIEARAAASLNHPSIVAVYDRGGAGESPFAEESGHGEQSERGDERLASMLSPSLKVPLSISLDSGFSISLCMARRSGLAPNFGS